MGFCVFPATTKLWHLTLLFQSNVVLQAPHFLSPPRLCCQPVSKLPWMDSKLKDLIKQKHRAWNAYKRLPSSDLRRAFCALRNKVTSALRSAEKQFLLSLHRESRLPNRCDSVKRFWSYVKRITGKVKGSSVPDLEVQRGNNRTTVTSDADKADVLNQYFAHQTVLQDCPKSFPDLPPPSELSPESFNTTPSEVYDTLSKLKPGKAPGLDGLPPKMLSLCASGIASSLCLLFNRSFQEGTVPQAWKEAVVVPVHKGGCKNSPSNYRPIALLSIVSKVMEKIVHKRLNAFLEPLLSKKQSGFRRKDGTSPQLIRLVQEWSTSLDASDLVGIIFFDFKKAFDRVCLPGLLVKLRSTGLCGKALSWCESFLTNRCQRVRVGSHVSSPEFLHAGVPQGAILSPLFFNIYINDIVECTNAEVNLFADDTSVYVTEKSGLALQNKLQEAVNKLASWFKAWAITINHAKSAAMVISKKRNPIKLDIHIDDTPIPQANSHKHLGLVLNNKLSWSDHVEHIRSKAAKKVGLLRRIRKRLPSLVLRTLYITCIRPTLEYASGAWGGVGTHDADRLERLQRSAARLITNITLQDQLPHKIILARAGLQELKARRSQEIALSVHRLITCPKTTPYHLLDAFQKWNNSIPSTQTTLTLRSAENDSLRLPRPRTEALRLSPFYRAVCVLNSLPPESKSSVSALKSHFSILS